MLQKIVLLLIAIFIIHQKTNLKRGSQIIQLEISDILKNKSKYEWYFTVGTPIYNHYRGLIHSHTEASDGHGSYNDAYYLARDRS